jgi:TolB-like protein
MERRLAAILATDVVGYSRLIRVDEEGTIAALKALRVDLIDPKIAEHHGRIVKLMGDGMLAEFPSVVDAVRAAVQIQEALAEHNSGLPEDQRIEFRVGINLGDVVIDGDDVHGDGVNIAARLEGLAKSGGICISGGVYDQVRDRIDVPFDDMGEQDVKNIDRPVRVWHWSANSGLQHQAGRGTTQRAGKPAIAVLPFDNMSGDPEQEYFSDGIAEDVITELSRFHALSVIARNSSFQYKSKSLNLRVVGEELNVDYVIEGSVRKAGSRVRVTAQLIETRSGSHLWADRFDRDLQDMFVVQDEITTRIVGAVAPGVVAAEIKRAKRKDIASLDAWDRIMRAHWHLARFTMQDNAEARRLLAEAAQIEPESSLAFGDLAMVHAWDGVWGWGISRDQSLAAAVEAARRAIEIDEENSWGHIALGLADLFAWRFDEARDRLRRAIEISPNDPSAHGYLGLTLALEGEAEAANAEIEMAIGLSPRDPFLAVWFMSLAVASFVEMDYEKAIRWAKKSIDENPRFAGAHRALTASLSMAGREDEARSALGGLLEQIPGLTVRATRQQVPLKRPSDLNRYCQGLSLAGLPE